MSSLSYILNSACGINSWHMCMSLANRFRTPDRDSEAKKLGGQMFLRGLVVLSNFFSLLPLVLIQ